MKNEIKIQTMKKQQQTNGFSIHCHHNRLVEYCYDYQGRVGYIKREKPKSEQKIRLKVFKLLPPEAIKEIPTRLQEAGRQWERASWQWEEAGRQWHEASLQWIEAVKQWHEASGQWHEAGRQWEEADRQREEASKQWQEASNQWPQPAQDAFHNKWCGCKWWDGAKLDFSE